LKERYENAKKINRNDVCKLVQIMGRPGMSEEESSMDEEGPFHRKLIAKWRSTDLNKLMENLDHVHPNKKKIQRRIIKVFVDNAEVVAGLPSNCYSIQWISENTHTLSTHLKPIQPFDFTVKPM
jgi:hypothetical protein